MGNMNYLKNGYLNFNRKYIFFVRIYTKIWSNFLKNKKKLKNFEKVIDKINILWYNLLSKRDAPSLHLDFFHTRNEHTARFYFYC